MKSEKIKTKAIAIGIVAVMVFMGSLLIMPGLASATIHSGCGVVAESDYLNFGTGDIFWSIANEERGYFYGSSFSTPTVYFADKIEDYWGSYDSYQGVQHIWEFTNASDHEWFTQHCITFAEETSPYYTGILLIQQGGLYGAVKPKSIHNHDLSHPGEYVLEYDWWYEDTGGSDFSSLKPFWAEINYELDALITKVNATDMPNIIKQRLIDKLEYAKELKDNAKEECEAGNFDGATKKLGVAESQVESFASMVKITRRINSEDKASFLADSTEIIGKIDRLIEYIETEQRC